ncbi:extracellular matrix protein 1-like isoform X2 [Corythoichthys intestinalis]|uniref:extracellular matrix protein 1-like isoform X2 n=1 Tax=Corythoichthys intestinalis TaxID=161448 RepID=UPI0025A5D0A9|nr:extracellular matrix protein 1-like isoform X2 [Corythoichthys intestinalis]
MTWIGLIQAFGILLIAWHNNLGESVNVPFPPARPTASNLANICTQGQGRPRYADSFFPRSGAGHFKRRGKAINRLESWYARCCGLPAERLCCARQAWKEALSQFCTEEFMTMSGHYECCRMDGDERWTCFDSELPNPDYEATPGYTAPAMPFEPGFDFDVNAC